MNDPIAYQIVREEIHVNSVRTSYMVDPQIGYARLDLFSETSTQELRSAISNLRQSGMRGMILDLRSNPGGLLDQGVSVSDLFMEPGRAIVETRARNPRDTHTFRSSRPEEFPGMPIVVLVDQFSASAAEIVAGALQDHDRALVIGAPTFGKGSVQTLFPLSGGNYLKMTTGKWYTPSGRSIQKDRGTDGDAVALLEDEPLAPDGTPLEVEETVDTANLEEFRTEAGRIVYGGGGIVPDLIVPADTMTLAERAFFEIASRAGNAYTNVLFSYAVEFAQANPDLAENFPVTTEMERELHQRLTSAGIDVDWEQLQGASRLVDRHLGSEIARAKWGQEAQLQRQNRDDVMVTKAIELLRQAPDQQALFGMVERQASLQ